MIILQRRPPSKFFPDFRKFQKASQILGNLGTCSQISEISIEKVTMAELGLIGDPVLSPPGAFAEPAAAASQASTDLGRNGIELVRMAAPHSNATPQVSALSGSMSTDFTLAATPLIRRLSLLQHWMTVLEPTALQLVLHLHRPSPKRRARHRHQ